MKYLYLLAVVSVLFSSCDKEKMEMPLAGEWNLLIDSLINPETARITELEYKQVISLPGTLDKAGIGEPSGLDTTLNKEVLKTLTRKHTYVGPAYYSREIYIPDNWNEKKIFLKMERVIWKSTVWVDNVMAGSQNSLSTPHYFDLSGLLSPGRHILTICIDNRRQLNINSSDFAHAYTDQTQIKWNGILGEFSLKATPDVSIGDIRIFPHRDSGRISGTIQISGITREKLALQLSILDDKGKKAGSAELEVNSGEIPFLVSASKGISGWNEFDPKVYQLKVRLTDEGGQTLDTGAESFGFRSIEQKEGQMLLNGQRIFLRGTLECSIFPLTGHPPLNKEEWKNLLLKARDYGLNHLRFHSWCPPEAAFEAADELGFYLQVELPNWSLSYGEDAAVVEFIEKEADRILSEYGNHPSFLMLCMGNELMGDFNQINGLVKRLKEKDDRRLYTATAFTFQNDHWGFHEPYDDYYITQWTDSGWVRGQGVFDQYPPNFRHNYDPSINHIRIPVISHEIGQYSVYPNLLEIDKYTGVLSPLNFMAIRKDLEAKGRLGMASTYTEATGKFATILYKEEIERAYKTAGLSGFQLLDLHDFPGQGTALVGMLDAFWDSKGFTSGDDFRKFCSPLVPLLWFDKAVYSKSEVFRADVGVSNYQGDLENAELVWTIKDMQANILNSGAFSLKNIANGTVSKEGSIEMALGELITPNVLDIELELRGTSYRNSWKVWVYDDEQIADPGQVILTSSFELAIDALKKGKKVLLSPPLNHIDGIEGKFVPVFWSPVHFPNQPGTMGILCDTVHPVFNKFPTEFHSNWQWWDISTNSKTIDISELQVDALITVIDNFFKNRDLTNLFEASVGEGSLVFSSIDLFNNLDVRPASKQLLVSIIDYMNSGSFHPSKAISEEKLFKFNTNATTEKSDILSIYK